MEQFGQATLASIFTAFVMRETGINFQVQLSSSLNGIDVMLDGELINLGSNLKERMIPTEKATILVTGSRKKR